MTDSDKVRSIMARSIHQAIVGNLDEAGIEAINTALTTGDILHDADTSPVVDATHTPLKRNEVYLYRGKRIRVTDWKFGSGNLMDTYYWVYFIDSDLKDGRVTIDAKHQRDRTRLYQAPFEPLGDRA